MSNRLEIEEILRIDRIYLPLSVNRTDQLQFIAQHNDKFGQFTISFGDIGYRRVAKLSYEEILSQPAIDDCNCVAIQNTRTILRLDIVGMGPGDGMVYDLNKIVFYSIDRAIRIIKRVDDFDLEYFQICTDEDIFRD